MSLFDFTKRMTLGMKIIYSIVAVGIIAAIVVGIVMYNTSLNAKTMRIVRVEGTVRIEQADGGTKTVTKKSRFQSGDAVFTGIDGSATVEIDDTKTVILRQESRSEFTKRNNQFEVRLTKGGLLFDVAGKLNDGETFEIKTNTMNIGIRGTSGYLSYDEDGSESLIVTDGTVIVTASNPDTGEKKYAEVHGGQKITVRVYSDRDTDSVEYVLEDVTEKDLPEFVLLTIADDDALLNRICQNTGWNRNTLLVLVDNLIKASANNNNTPVTETTVPEDGTTVTPTPKTDDPGSVTPTEAPEVSETTAETTEKQRDPDATATPKPTATNTPKPTKKPTSTPKPIVTSTPRPTATSTPKPTPTPAPTATPTPEPTATPTPEPTATPTPEPTEEPEPELVGFDVTVEVTSLAEDGSEVTDVITVDNVPVSGDGPSTAYLDSVLSGYVDYRIISSSPIYE